MNPFLAPFEFSESNIQIDLRDNLPPTHLLISQIYCKSQNEASFRIFRSGSKMFKFEGKECVCFTPFIIERSDVLELEFQSTEEEGNDAYFEISGIDAIDPAYFKPTYEFTKPKIKFSHLTVYSDAIQIDDSTPLYEKKIAIHSKSFVRISCASEITTGYGTLTVSEIYGPIYLFRSAKSAPQMVQFECEETLTIKFSTTAPEQTIQCNYLVEIFEQYVETPTSYPYTSLKSIELQKIIPFEDLEVDVAFPKYSEQDALLLLDSPCHIGRIFSYCDSIRIIYIYLDKTAIGSIGPKDLPYFAFTRELKQGSKLELIAYGDPEAKLSIFLEVDR